MLKASCLKNAHYESGIQRKVVSGHWEQVHTCTDCPARQVTLYSHLHVHYGQGAGKCSTNEIKS